MRKDYPFIVELFRNEKFFKDLGQKAVFAEAPNDSLSLEFLFE